MKPAELVAVGACLVIAAGYLIHLHQTRDLEARRVAAYEKSNELEAKRLYLLDKETRKDWEPPPVPPEKEALAKLLKQAGESG